MNSTVKIILSIVVIALVGLLAGIGVPRLLKGKTGNDKNIANGQFAWGITVLTFPFRTYHESFTATQMAKAKELGVGYVRIDYLPSNPKAAEVAIDAAAKNGLDVVLVIPFGPNDIFTDKNLTKNTENYISEIVKRFKGKVAVYQLATEVASVALRNDAGKHGIDQEDYPADALKAVTTWLKTAATTVKKGDSQALRLINDQWVHVGFFDHYIAEGGEFDMLGWNWFSDMGTDMETVVLDEKKGEEYELLTKLKSFGKPIWLTEVNTRLGSKGNKEKEQAEFISTMANYAAKEPAINGFFVFNLLEDQAAPPQEQGYSIIKAVDDGKEQKITGVKPAFDAYQKSIKKNN